MTPPARAATIAIAVLAGALALAGCTFGASDSPIGAGAASARGENGTITFVAYSTPQVVYDELIPAFQRAPAGKGIGVKTSFGASGDQSRAVEAGLGADVVSFSIEPDLERLVKADIVSPRWAATPTKGLVTTSLVTFIVRKGNPKGIRTWNDLLEPGVEVLTPNPFTSGAAKWNLLAAYGQASGAGKDPAAGLAYVEKLIRDNVKVQDKSAREALQSFVSGNGDVLLSYEYESTTAQKKGEDVDVVTPDATIRIEIPLAVTTTSKNVQAARAFERYVLSAPAQARFASWGYRPVNADVLRANAAKFPEPPGLFTIADLGGWPTVNEQLFDPETGSIAKIEEDAGVSSER